MLLHVRTLTARLSYLVTPCHAQATVTTLPATCSFPATRRRARTLPHVAVGLTPALTLAITAARGDGKSRLKLGCVGRRFV